MAKTINLIRYANARLVSADIDKLGVTFAAQSPYRADGFLKVNVTVANANPNQKMFLEGADFTIYAIGGNVNKLSAYSLSMFKELEQVWLFSSTMVEIEETDNNAYLDYLKPSCVIYVPSNLISNYQTTYSNLSSKFVPINLDYTLTIVGSGTLTSEIITDQLMNGTYNAQDREACTKLVISGFDNYMDALWGYNLSAVLPNFNNNVWYNATEIDFTTRELEGVDELLESDITDLISGISSDKINGVTQLKFSGFSDMSVALTYDYSDLPNLEYVWLDNVRYEKSKYKVVEYIESTGTQYIDTQIKPSSDTRFDLDIIFKNNNYVLGAMINIPNRYSINRYNNGEFYFYGSSVYFNAPINNRVSLIYKNDTFKVNETEYTVNMPAEQYTSINLYLCATNFRDTPTDYGNIVIYSCKLYEGNTIVRDFVPCYKDSNNEIGLYDLVSKIFYSNAGTGTFSKGNDTGEIIYGDYDISTYFYPLTDLVSEYDARLTQTFYLDYNGTLPSYPDYQLTYYTDINRTTTILPENMISGTRYYVKAVMVTLTIQGSGTLTSAIVESAVSKASSSVTKVVIDSGFTSIDTGIMNNLVSTLPNLNTYQLNQAKQLNLVDNQVLVQDYGVDTFILENYTGNITVNYPISNPDSNVCLSLKTARIKLNGQITGTKIFMKCSNLENVVFEEGLTSINKEQLLFKCYKVKRVEFPSTMTSYNGGSTYGAMRDIGTQNGQSKTYIYLRSNTLLTIPFNKDDNSQAVAKLYFYVPASVLIDYMNDSTWATYNSKIQGFFTYNGTLPTFTGYTPTFYEDEDCTIAITQADMVVDTQYYVKLTAI